MAEGLRIVTFNVFPPAYGLVAGWAARHGHRLVLLVTSPGREGERYGLGYRELVAAVPGDQDVLITTRLRRTAAPTIAALAPDLNRRRHFPAPHPARGDGDPALRGGQPAPGAPPTGTGTQPDAAGL